jgi:hypothetical protein
MMDGSKATRRAAMWSAVALAAVIGPGVAFADQISPAFNGGGGRHSGPGLRVEGRALAQTGERQGYGISLRAAAGEEADEARGWVKFGQRSADGAEGFMGVVECLSRDSAGVVQLTGTIRRSGAPPRQEGDEAQKPSESADPTAFLDEILPDGAEPAPSEEGDEGRGGPQDGKDFAITIDVPGDPQHFSVAKVADAGTLSACSGGESQTLEVTRGGFRTTITEGR